MATITTVALAHTRRRWIVAGAFLVAVAIALATAAWFLRESLGACPGADRDAVAVSSEAGAWSIECSIDSSAPRGGDFQTLVRWTSSDGTQWEINRTPQGDAGLYLQYLATDGTFDLFSTGVDLGSQASHRLRVDGVLSGSDTNLRVSVDSIDLLEVSLAGDVRPA